MRDTTKSRVLVVEDDSAVRTTVAMMLRRKGYEVETANDGFEALLCLNKQVFNLIISDLNMPQMSGFELLSVVRRRFPEVLVIATSGAYDAANVPSGVLADGFYGKGRASAAELLELVDHLMQGGPLVQDRATAPVWIPRNGKDHDGKPFVVLTCTECLRSFPFSVEREPTDEMLTTPCIYCPHEISYIIDFSRSVTSPGKRVAWRAAFLKSQDSKTQDQKAGDTLPLAEVKREMGKARLVKSARRLAG